MFRSRSREFSHGNVPRAAIMLLILVAASPWGVAGDLHGDWPTFRQNAQQTGVAPSPLPEKLELLWQVDAGGEVLATITIANGRAYVPCLSGDLLCLDLKTGKTLWKYQSVETVPANSFAPGFKSSPTITTDAIYLGDEDGLFHAVDRQTGKKLWTYKTGGEIYSGAAISKGSVLFGSYDNSLYCLNQLDGTLKWKYETQGYVHCSPAIADRFTFISGCDEHLRMIDIETGKQVAELPVQTYMIASPAVVGDRLYVGTYASEVIAIDWKKLEIVWRYRHAESEFPYHASAAVNDRMIVIGGRDKLVHAIDRATGKGLWTFPTRAKVDSSPAIQGDRVFVGSIDGNLYELGLADGKERWKARVGKVSAGPSIGEGVLIIGSESRDGTVSCFGKKSTP